MKYANITNKSSSSSRTELLVINRSSKLNRFTSKRLMCFFHICISQSLNWELGFPVLAVWRLHVGAKDNMQCRMACVWGWLMWKTALLSYSSHLHCYFHNAYLELTLCGGPENCTEKWEDIVKYLLWFFFFFSSECPYCLSSEQFWTGLIMDTQGKGIWGHNRTSAFCWKGTTKSKWLPEWITNEWHDEPQQTEQTTHKCNCVH